MSADARLMPIPPAVVLMRYMKMDGLELKLRTSNSRKIRFVSPSKRKNAFPFGPNYVSVTVAAMCTMRGGSTKEKE